MRTILLSLVLFLACGRATGQKITLLHDSLEERLRSERNDTTRVDLHEQLALIYIDQLDDSLALVHLRKGVELAGHLHYLKGLTYAPLLAGIEQYHRRNYAEALERFKQCIQLLDKEGVRQGLLSPLSFIRQVFNDAGLQEEKRDFYLAKLAYYEKHGPAENIGICQHGLGGYYYFTGQGDKAIEHYLRAREIFAEFDPAGYANELWPIGAVYLSWGNLQKAEIYQRQALQENLKVGLLSNVIASYNALANVLLQLGDTLGALQQMNESRPYWGRCTPQLLAPRILSLVNIHIGLHQLDSAGHYLAFADSLAHLVHLPISSVKGEIELDYYHYLYLRARGNDAEADEALERALRSAQQQDLIKYIQKYRKELVTRYRKRGTVQMALDTLMLFTRVNDSLTTDADRKKVASYEGEMKERESALEILQQQGSIRQQRIMLFSIGTGLLLLIALAYSVHRGKKRSDELLLNILPAQVAAELKGKGHADAKHFDHVTVLFTDFKGFTAMSEQVSPQQLVKDLHECFSAFDLICEKYGIEKIKTIGDAYMAAGGLPTPNTTHATDVIKAAFEMRDFIAEGKARKIAAGLPFFEIRIGIHTGPVVAGIVGVKKFSYDIWGDTVNTASRMESSGEVGQVNISEATYALVKEVRINEAGVTSTLRVDRNKDAVVASRTTNNEQRTTRPAFTFTPRGKVRAKGKGEMEMYFVRWH